ncbi:MAG: nucleotidyltransferase domain-containing protein [Actinomycetota bacterium]|jgi:predicted nucleotidyltransferase|nr:nucleotidyltransferase domain-containing protein [Actinomycetota bacterium]
MVTALEDKRDAIAALCRKYGVVRMDVFGSALRDDYRIGESDIDLLADFGDQDPFELIDAYFDLLDELRSLLGTDVDLVMSDAIKNRYIRAEVERTKQALYAA